MGITVGFSDPRGEEESAVFVSLTDAIRYGDLSLSQSALIGEPSVSQVMVDDPTGSLNIVGWRNVLVQETSAPSNNSIVWAGVTGDRRVTRSPSLRTTVARQWSVDFIDDNWQIGRRIFVNSSAKRPVETPGDRLRWLLQASGIAAHDYGHVTYPTTPSMDAVDYRGQNFKALLDDIALATGYNYWCERNEAHQAGELFFMDPDSADYASTIEISNVLADVDYVTVFPPYEDAELQRSPRRVAAGVYLAYDGGSVFVRDQGTADQFANVEQTAPQYNVKTATAARARATRFLNEHNEEEDVIRCAIKVPAASVNAVRAGHLMYGRFTHLPGYESPSAFRVARRAVIQEAEAGQSQYKIDLDLVPVDAPARAWTCPLDPGITGTASKTYENLNGTTTDADGIVWYANSNGAWFGDLHGEVDGPYPNQVCHGLGFGDYSPSGDGGGSNVDSKVLFLTLGPGTATSHWGLYVGAGTNMEWSLTYQNATGPTTISSGSFTVTGETTHVVTVSDLPADATSCYQWITYKITTGIGGSGARFRDVVWAATGGSGGSGYVNPIPPPTYTPVGYGKNAKSSTTRTDYHVTTTSDTGTQGSLRHAWESGGSNINIVFDQPGTYDMAGGDGSEPDMIGRSNVVMDGSTSGGSVTLTGAAMRMQGCNHIVIRHIAFRNTDSLSVWYGQLNVDVNGGTGSHDIMIDHCSFSGYTWRGVNAGGVNSHSMTIQWCFFGPSGTGALSDAMPPYYSYPIYYAKATRLSVDHCVFYNCQYRQPGINYDMDAASWAAPSYTVADIANSLMWSTITEYSGGEPRGYYSFVNVHNGATANVRQCYFHHPTVPGTNRAIHGETESGAGDPGIYISGCKSKSDYNALTASYSVGSPYSTTGYELALETTATVAATECLQYAGRWPRDSIDAGYAANITIT